MAVMGKRYTFTLDALDAGQLLDGLAARAEAWEKTGEYLQNGSVADDAFFVIEECSDAEEAEHIARHYRSIIGKIRHQMGKPA